MAGSSFAEAMPPEEVSVTVSADVLPPEDGRYTGPCMGDEAFGRTWLDRTHAYITEMLCQPSVWFDGFFGNNRAGEEWPGSLIRWQGAYRLDERMDETGYRSEFRASFRLPRMTSKFRLTVASESDSDPADVHPDDSPIAAPTGNGKSPDSGVTAGWKYYLTDVKRARISLGGGVKLENPLKSYLRLRLRYTQPLGSSTLFRFTPIVTWVSEEGLNRSLRLDLDHRPSEKILLRALQSFSRKELDPGTSWGTTLTLFGSLTSSTVLALETSATGLSYPENHVERYRLLSRLRSNYFRKWLFLELEPEYYWPVDDLGEYHLFRAITFRLEMQFYS
ncbi:MAG: hypothetical protein RRA15_12865 [bacterium]|nr:hypothetical protein [bacterium]MDT8367353.1 hypothetical protein [bacterium]